MDFSICRPSHSTPAFPTRTRQGTAGRTMWTSTGARSWRARSTSHANSSTATSGLSALTPGSKSKEYEVDYNHIQMILGGMSSARKMHFQPIFERKRLSDIVLVWRRITGIIENWTSSYFGTFASISLELIMNPRFFNSLVWFKHYFRNCNVIITPWQDMAPTEPCQNGFILGRLRLDF